jgi:hypothetical protein
MVFGLGCRASPPYFVSISRQGFCGGCLNRNQHEIQFAF